MFDELSRQEAALEAELGGGRGLSGSFISTPPRDNRRPDDDDDDDDDERFDECVPERELRSVAAKTAWNIARIRTDAVGRVAEESLAAAARRRANATREAMSTRRASSSSPSSSYSNRRSPGKSRTPSPAMNGAEHPNASEHGFYADYTRRFLHRGGGAFLHSPASSGRTSPPTFDVGAGAVPDFSNEPGPRVDPLAFSYWSPSKNAGGSASRGPGSRQRAAAAAPPPPRVVVPESLDDDDDDDDFDDDSLDARRRRRREAARSPPTASWGNAIGALGGPAPSSIGGASLASGLAARDDDDDDDAHSDAHVIAAVEKVRSISHWSPYDRVGVANADP